MFSLGLFCCGGGFDVLINFANFFELNISLSFLISDVQSEVVGFPLDIASAVSLHFWTLGLSLSWYFVILFLISLWPKSCKNKLTNKQTNQKNGGRELLTYQLIQECLFYFLLCYYVQFHCFAIREFLMLFCLSEFIKVFLMLNRWAMSIIVRQALLKQDVVSSYRIW